MRKVALVVIIAAMIVFLWPWVYVKILESMNE